MSTALGGAHAAHGLFEVIECPDLAYDEMYVAAAGDRVMVGEAAHLRWRLWLGEQRREAADDARWIVRTGLGDPYTVYSTMSSDHQTQER